MQSILVKARTGRYEGYVDDNGTACFLGIHYVQTPRRWKRGEELLPSDDLIPAREFSPICPQPILPEEHPSDTPMSEDCLTLNIWTQDPSKKGRPVMIWIHGGCYLTGSNRIPYYCNDRFAADCPDIVFVNINYRLGSFGSMDLSDVDMTGEYQDAPNLQTYDQMAAVKWVYENIEAFGGDPANITVYGQSAGSYSTSTLLLIPEVNQYISKAICESSGFEKTQKTVEDSQAMGREFMKVSGASTLEELLALTTQEVLAASMKVYENPAFPRAFASVRDGRLIPANPYAELAGGIARHVTLMSGTVLGEYDTAAYGLPDEAIRERILALFGDRVTEDILSQYIQNDPSRSLREAYMDCRNDMAIRMPVLTTMESQCRSGATTYSYYIDYIPEGAQLRTQHLFEIPFFNDKLDIPVHMDQTFDEPVQGKQPDAALGRQIQGCWANFARFGNPSGDHIGVEWPSYNLEDKPTMVISNTGWHVEKHFRAADTALLQHFMTD